MKNKKSLFNIFLIFIDIIFVIVFCYYYFFTDSPAADGFEISSYNVILDVQENNVVDVTEEIEVNFTESDKHGIYKITPQWLKYTGYDGKTIKRKSIVSEYRAVGDIYVVDGNNDKVNIRIGDENNYVGLGLKKYVVKYTYDMGKDPYNGVDEFIFHLYGDYWGTEIKNPTFQVIMPKNIDSDKINFYMDKYRKYSANEYVDYRIDGNVLYASFNDDKYRDNQERKYCYEELGLKEGQFCYLPYNKREKLTHSLTFDIELPEGYFVGGSYNYSWISFILCLLIFVLTIWHYVKWKKYGKDLPKKSRTVEFYPPENYSSAEIGYIYGRQSNKKLTISLIVQLASKGYIKIDELDDEENSIQITNLICEPVEELSYDELVPERFIKIKKLRDADDLLKKREISMMKHLFMKDDVRVLKTGIDRFLKSNSNLIKKGYIEILEDNVESRFDEFNKRKKEFEQSQVKYNLDMIEYNNCISKMPSLSVLEQMVYNKLFKKKNVIILSEHRTFYQVFDEVDIYLDDKLKDLVHDKISNKMRIFSIFITIITIILYYISSSVIEDMDPRFDIFYKLAFISIIINFILFILMKRKTKYGEEICAKVDGFRHFLITAEKKQLEALVMDNPNYYYDILPYTYVLNVSKKWVEKFEDIPIPEEDKGSYDYSDSRSLDRMNNSVYRPSSSSGGRNSGGGGSSFGGGCSSCGGGGSW